MLPKSKRKMVLIRTGSCVSTVDLFLAMEKFGSVVYLTVHGDASGTQLLIATQLLNSVHNLVFLQLHSGAGNIVPLLKRIKRDLLAVLILPVDSR